MSFNVTWLPPARYSPVGSQLHQRRQFHLLQPFAGDFGQVTSLPGHFLAPEVTWHHLLSHDCLLQRATVLLVVKRTKKAVSNPLQPLPGDFRSNVTSPSLVATWGYVMSFSVSLLPPPSSYSLVGSQLYKRCVFGFLQPLPGDFQSNDVPSGSLPAIWGHMWFHVTWLPPPASYSLVGGQTAQRRQFSASYSQFQVTSGQMTSLPGHFGHLRSCHIISCHVIASSRVLQHGRKSNAPKTRPFGPLQPPPGDFSSNDFTSRSLFVTRGDVTSFPAMWLPPPASYSLVGSQTPQRRQLAALYGQFQVISSKITSVTGHFRSLEVLWHYFCHVTASSGEQHPCRKSNTPKMPVLPSTATSTCLPIKWRHFQVTSGHPRSRNVVSCHVTASSCELQPCR